MAWKRLSSIKAPHKRILYILWGCPLYLGCSYKSNISKIYIKKSKISLTVKMWGKRINGWKVKLSGNGSHRIAEWFRNSTGIFSGCLVHAVFLMNHQNVPERPTLCSLEYVSQFASTCPKVIMFENGQVIIILRPDPRGCQWSWQTQSAFCLKCGTDMSYYLFSVWLDLAVIYVYIHVHIYVHI